MNKLLKVITSRIFLTVALILAQLIVLFTLIVGFSIDRQWVYVTFSIIAFLLILYVINMNNIDVSYKLAWILVLTVIPIIGPVLYIIFANKKIPKALRLDTEKVISRFKENLPDGHGLITAYGDPNHLSSFQNYLVDNGAGCAIHTQCNYFGMGDEMFPQLIKDLQSAKHFILMEYFIVSPGKIWDSIFEILKQKVAQGVIVKFIYDDFGTITTMPRHFLKDLRKAGIDAYCFNPIAPFLIGAYNYRDHRKITVVDNQIGYMGGINLADEYANLKVRFGNWKDSAVRLEGEAVWNYTVMFLQEFEVLCGKTIDFNWYRQYGCTKESTALVTSFADAPTDDNNLGLDAHLTMLYDAKDYVYISAPYLLFNQSLLTAIIYAAKRGVDVRIITPYIPDKWYVHIVSQSYYARLIKAGVKVYEYTPGFIHSKTWVCDDIISIVGTTNVDYRSYYLNFECNTIITDQSFALSCRDDYLTTLNMCKAITLSECENQYLLKRVVTALCAVFAPLF